MLTQPPNHNHSFLSQPWPLLKVTSTLPGWSPPLASVKRPWKTALYYSLWELWQDCFVTWIKSWNVRGNKSSIRPMSLQKRFKILPERTGYEKLLISPVTPFKRKNSWTNQNNIFKVHIYIYLIYYRVIWNMPMSVVKKERIGWYLEK